MLNSKRGDIVGDCPRCGEHSMLDPQVLNALSRTTRGLEDIAVYVCSPCGTDEGMLEYFTKECQPQSEWPIDARAYEFNFDNKYWETKNASI